LDCYGPLVSRRQDTYFSNTTSSFGGFAGSQTDFFSTLDIPARSQEEAVMVGADKWDKLSVFLGILLFFFLSYPLLEIFNCDFLVAGIPLMPLYLFGIWLVAIATLYLLGRWMGSR
jgi:hypothetical protein